MPSLTEPLSRRSFLQAGLLLGAGSQLRVRAASIEYSSLIVITSETQGIVWIDQFRRDVAETLGTSCDVPACATVGPGELEEACRLIAAGAHLVEIRTVSYESAILAASQLLRLLIKSGLSQTKLCPMPRSSQSLRLDLGIPS